MKHTREDLQIMQGWSLERKIMVTQTRIMEWYIRYPKKAEVGWRFMINNIPPFMLILAVC